MTKLVEVRLARIIISDIDERQVIYLEELEGDRSLPIVIGLFEATSIDRRIKNDIPPRPLTHDLLKNLIEHMGGRVKDVIINNLHDHMYFAVIRIQRGDELIELDSRPSDAIALAVHCEPRIPIFVADDVMDSAA